MTSTTLPEGLKVVVDDERCKGCNLCVTACPNDALALSKTRYNSRGLAIVELVNNDACTSCGICSKICPDVALEVYKW